MVDVWLALSGRAGMEKACVIKRVIPIQGPEREQLERRFRQRADIAIRLAHGAIAQTIGVGDVGGEIFLVEEFVHGKDLLDVTKRHLSVAAAVQSVAS
jgi:serine/threonine-protein kinase